jgi:hypothetical protein
MNRIAMVFGTASILALSGAAFAEQPLTIGQMDAITAGGAFGTTLSQAIALPGTTSTWNGVYTNTQVIAINVPTPGAPATPTTVFATQNDVQVGANALAQSGVATGTALAGSTGQAIGNWTSDTVSDNPLAPAIGSAGAYTSANLVTLQVQAISGNVSNAVSYGPAGTPAFSSSASSASTTLF